MHSTNSQCPYLTSDLDLTASRSCHAHWRVKILKPKQSVSLPIKSMQIKPSLNETDYADMLIGLSWKKPRIPTTIGNHTCFHVQTESLALSPMCCHDFLMCSSSIGHVDRWYTYGRNRAFNRWYTCLHAPTDFWVLLHTTMVISGSNHTPKKPYWCHLTSYNNVINPH